jgi:hypothetical protein
MQLAFEKLFEAHAPGRMAWRKYIFEISLCVLQLRLCVEERVLDKVPWSVSGTEIESDARLWKRSDRGLRCS